MIDKWMNHIDVWNMKLGAFIGILVTSPLESKLWVVLGYMIGVGTTWLIRKKICQ